MANGYSVILSFASSAGASTDIEFDLCDYSFQRDINEKTGVVQSKVKGGTIYLGCIDAPPKDLLEWGMSHTMKDGSLKVMRDRDDKGTYIPEEELTFVKGACVSLKIKYDRFSTEHFCTFISISADDVTIGGTDDWVRKNWKLDGYKT